MTLIHIPADWDDQGLITFEEFCVLIRTPQRTVRDWRRRGVGPTWGKADGIGRLYITVAEARRFLHSVTDNPLSRPSRPVRPVRTIRDVCGGEAS